MGRRILGLLAAVMAMASDPMLMAAFLEGTARRPKPSVVVRCKAAAHYNELQQKGLMEFAGQPSGSAADQGGFCLHWLWHFVTYQNLQDLARSGRPRKIVDAQVREAARFIDKAAAARDFQACSSAAKCCARIPGVKRLLEKTQVKPKTLFHHIRRLGLLKPTCVYYKKPLSKMVQDKRLKICEEWLRKGVYVSAEGVTTVAPRMGDPAITIPLPPNPKLNKKAYAKKWLKPWARRIIWIDSKKFYIHPTTFKIWSSYKEFTQSDERLLNVRPWCIHYYSAVSCEHGGILIKFVSGTAGKGYKPNGGPDGKGYMVGGWVGGWRAGGIWKRGLHQPQPCPRITEVWGTQMHLRGAAGYGCVPCIVHGLFPSPNVRNMQPDNMVALRTRIPRLLRIIQELPSGIRAMHAHNPVLPSVHLNHQLGRPQPKIIALPPFD